MKEHNIYSYDQIWDRVGLNEEQWERVYRHPAEERKEAIRRELQFPEGFLAALKGLSLEQQLEYYRVVETCVYSSTAYGKITKENRSRYGCAAADYRDLMGLIVDDGVVIGLLVRDAFRPWGDGKPMFPYQDICTYYASDNNGSGSKDREDYAHLCCVMPE